MDLTLACYFHFPAKSCFIPIEIKSNADVQQLAKAIYEDLKLRGWDVELDDLRLYKTDITTKPYEDQAERALEWLRRQERNAHLDPAKKLEVVFPDGLSKGTFHIIVALDSDSQGRRVQNAPGAPIVSLNCLVLGNALDKIFTIEIASNDNVSILKGLIKSSQHVCFGQTVSTDIQLVQVSLPAERVRVPENVDIGQGRPLTNNLEKISNLFQDPRYDYLHIVAYVGPDGQGRMGPNDSPVTTEFRPLIMSAHQQTFITTNDLVLNQIIEEGSPNALVQEFEALLKRPRRFGNGTDLVGVARQIISRLYSLSEPITDVPRIPTQMNIDISSDDSATPEAGYACTLSELIHVQEALGHDHSKSSGSDAFSEIHYGEELADYALFYPFALTLRESPVLKFRLRHHSWPFKILIRVDQSLFSYQPESDFQITCADFPRFLVEVQSQASEAGKSRLLFQAAFVVKFVNTLLIKYSEKRDFFLVTAYITRDGMVERRIVYLDQDGKTVNYTKPRTFELGDGAEHAAFLCELYNLASWVAVTGSEVDVKDILKVGKLKAEFNAAAKKSGVRAWTAKPSRNRLDEGSTEERSTSQRRRTEDPEDKFAEQPKAGGYRAEPLFFEDDFGGIWEAVGPSLPSTVRTVYKKSDVKQTNPLIAKRVAKSSPLHELRVLSYLSAKPSPSPYIVSLRDNFGVGTATFLIFPKLSPISKDALCRGKIKEPCQSLVSGVAYLHTHGVAHLDLKPDNLLYHTRTGQPKIIDFDIAVRVESEEQEIEGYGGTPGWTAPEIGEEGGPKQKYSAIRADRWACGRVLKMFLRHERELEPRFSHLAEQLLAENPRERPSLVEWCKVDAGGAEGVDVSGEMARAYRRERTDEYDALEPLSKKLKVAPVVE